MSQEKEYWEDRYSTGGNSGWCSVGDLRKWRWNIIKKHASLKNKSVLDVGCGDLRFWENKDHKDYTGLDISSVIIERNKILCPNWKFICSDVSILDLDKRFDVVFCFEMLFHIMTEAAYIRILQNLNRWTKETLFISCWSKRPDPFVHPHYQAHYQLEEYLQFLPDVRLNKHYSTRKGLRAMYVFERQQR